MCRAALEPCFEAAPVIFLLPLPARAACGGLPEDKLLEEMRSSAMTLKICAQGRKALGRDEVCLPQSDVPLSQVEARAMSALVLLALRSL